jgi:FkbM family methyltransferase
MKMLLNLSDWAERRAYFTGRYYQEDVEELLSRLLRGGDNFVDVGANIGLLSLHAAALVGPSGTIWAFEPNPDTYQRLSRHFEINELTDVHLHQCGLGSEAGSLTMNVYGRHSGKATLVDQAANSANSMLVEVRRGDEALKELDAAKPTVVKIDVEGFEVAVLEGLSEVLKGNVAVIVEVSRRWLELAGTSATRLHELLEYFGLVPHEFYICERRFSRELIVVPAPGPLDLDQYDCLFTRPGSIFADRVGASLHGR